jgi:hypothetical protein
MDIAEDWEGNVILAEQLSIPRADQRWISGGPLVMYLHCCLARFARLAALFVTVHMLPEVRRAELLAAALCALRQASTAIEAIGRERITPVVLPHPELGRSGGNLPGAGTGQETDASDAITGALAQVTALAAAVHYLAASEAAGGLPAPWAVGGVQLAIARASVRGDGAALHAGVHASLAAAWAAGLAGEWR